MKGLVAAAALLVGLTAMVAAQPHWGLESTRFLLAGATLLVPWMLGILAARRAGASGRNAFLVVLLAGVIARGILLAEPLQLSDDLYRYVWDGRVTLAGMNPYRYPPTAPELAFLRDDLWPLVNNPDLPTIYPPVLQVVFAGAAAVSPTVLGFRIVFTLCDLLAGVVLWRALARVGREQWVVAYLWHPLVLVEIAGSGHADAVGIALLALALWAAMAGRPLLAGIGTMLAGLVKFHVLAALPAFLRSLGWRWALLPLVPLLAYAPFHRDGVDALGSLVTYASTWRSNDFLFGVLHGTGEATEASLAAAKVRAALGVALVWVATVLLRRPWWSVVSWTVGTFYLLAPTVHPWYLLWLLPAALFVPHVAWWAWTVTVGLAYLPLAGYLETGVWAESTAWKAVQMAPVLVLLPVQAWLEARRRRDPGVSAPPGERGRLEA